ncbi:MAG TPA: diaminopimelate epimerase [Gammaproteobacteria bacterium]|nr:diaminopimelate epimerase [Gammaproteobacteria bacterium]
MMLEFTKMHGLGNDFVVIDAIHQKVELSPGQVRFLADRRFGVGCDQVLIVAPPDDAEVDFVYRIFNADGSEVEQCGNGARCFVRFVHDKGLSEARRIRVRTRAGVIMPELRDDGQVSVNMGVPDFAPAALPFETTATGPEYRLEIEGETVRFGAVSMGNPHIVLRVDDVAQAPVARLGAQLEAHAAFPNRVNVGFMEIIDRGHIRLRVFERGAGETLACGTGACAAVVVGQQQGVLDAAVEVQLRGGVLHIERETENGAVIMTGPAVSVYEGKIEL